MWMTSVLYDAQSDWKLDATKPRQELTRFKFPRNQDKKKAGGPNPCLSDLVAPIMAQRSDWVGVFALTAGHGLDELVAEFQKVGDDYNALLSKVLADRLAEAFAEELHERVRKDLWGYASEENLSFSELFESKYRGIRPAFGYPACPDHTDKQLAFDLLGAEQKCGMKLTESDMMLPAASVCGLYFANPSSYYFGVGVLAEDQVVDWAERKGIDTESARKRSGRA
ncbi:hypothetical protein MASR2M78_11540 [Treponema sp.]